MLASVAVSSPGHVTNQQTLQVRRFVVCHVNVDEKIKVNVITFFSILFPYKLFFITCLTEFINCIYISYVRTITCGY